MRTDPPPSPPAAQVPAQPAAQCSALPAPPSAPRRGALTAPHAYAFLAPPADPDEDLSIEGLRLTAAAFAGDFACMAAPGPADRTVQEWIRSLTCLVRQLVFAAALKLLAAGWTTAPARRGPSGGASSGALADSPRRTGPARMLSPHVPTGRGQAPCAAAQALATGHRKDGDPSAEPAPERLDRRADHLGSRAAAIAATLSHFDAVVRRTAGRLSAALGRPGAPPLRLGPPPPLVRADGRRVVLARKAHLVHAVLLEAADPWLDRLYLPDAGPDFRPDG